MLILASQEVEAEWTILPRAAKIGRDRGVNRNQSPWKISWVEPGEPQTVNKTKRQKQFTNGRAAQIWMEPSWSRRDGDQKPA